MTDNKGRNTGSKGHPGWQPTDPSTLPGRNPATPSNLPKEFNPETGQMRSKEVLDMQQEMLHAAADAYKSFEARYEGQEYPREARLLPTDPCPACGKRGAVVVDTEQLKAYKDGALLQNAFPNLTDGEREQFKSGFHSDCWDKMTAAWEEEEEEEEHTPVIRYRTDPECERCKTDEYVPHFNCIYQGRARGHSAAHCTADSCY